MSEKSQEIPKLSARGGVGQRRVIKIIRTVRVTHNPLPYGWKTNVAEEDVKTVTIEQLLGYVHAGKLVRLIGRYRAPNRPTLYLVALVDKITT